MSDILNIGRSGVLAYRDALATVSDNVVNANSDGFSKRQVVLKEQTAGQGSMIYYRNGANYNGVQSAQVIRVWDQYRASTAWSANSDASQASTRAQWLGSVQDAMSDDASGVGVRLTAVFTAGSALAANPSDSALRKSFLSALQDATQAINTTAGNLEQTGASITSQVQTGVTQVNDALNQLAQVNLALKVAPQGTSGRASLEDQRDAIIGTLSGQLGIDVSLDSYGAATVRLSDSGGPTLLDGSAVQPALFGAQIAASGRIGMTVTAGGQTSAVTATSGALAGYAEAASITADRRQQLDALASSLTTQLNAWNAQGKLASGAAGGALLSGTTADTIAATATDPAAIAASDGTTANGNLLTLSALRGDGGVEQAWRGMVADQALRVQSATTQATTAAATKDGAYSALDDTSGVDLDTEAADLLRYQQAYSASAKVIQTARDTLQSILDLF